MEKSFFKQLLVAFMLLIGTVGFAQTSGNPIGIWDFNVPDAPSEYASGKIEFKNQDDKLMLFFVGTNQARGFEVTKRENQYICRISANNLNMSIVLNPDGNNLKGTIGSGQWEMAIILTPEKK